MEKKEIINELVNRKPLHRSKGLSSWIQQSAENQKEYIRYKNTWALLQRGEEMNKKFVAEDLKLVKRKIGLTKNRFDFRQLLNYAAILVFVFVAGYFVRSLTTMKANRHVVLNEISVPNGNRSLVVFPDGSKALLTNGSKITYPGKFAEDSRDIRLEGEAFFTVKHNKKSPFFVNIGANRIKVLGTEFSVSAYPEENSVRVDLVSGRVQMDVAEGNGRYESYVLEPLHSLILDKKSGKLKKLPISDNFYKYWQKGEYDFKNESFTSLAKKIERIFSVKIIFEDDAIANSTFTGVFYIDSNIYTIIETFRRASNIPFEYKIEKDKIYIKTIK
ncbi:FecR family protein [Mariniphaga anaerophila]|uniref:FecR family protein n=1 Tax=Mariniphaga anaerophila TaxID=1484053 RepID=A0A1M4VD85_9BACT|nr:FecR domain-containing protein [Mariniphaga anaerophila]SHE66838.1 FecR family protein [Mariniphaga anaerophila]